ncbi:hypothetical protein GCM10027589_58710 [Actinocorallia lasiicapitis]
MVLAASPTWGITGPQFLAGYALAAVGLFVVALVIRRKAAAGRTPVRELHQYELAYLAGGERRAIAASLSGLRAGQAVTAAKHGILSLVAPPRMTLYPLDEAVLDGVRANISTGGLPHRPQVKAALSVIRKHLVAEGMLLTASERAQIRAAALPLFLLLGLGAVRVVSGIANDRPVLYLIMMMVPLALVTLILGLRAPKVSRAGKKTLTAAAIRHRVLSPSMSPSWSTYGPEAVALGVALYGGAVIYAMDPEFAVLSEMQMRLGLIGSGYTPVSSYSSSSSSSSSHTSSSSCSSGSSCSSSSSCSSGSSCGGGGGGGCGG